VGSQVGACIACCMDAPSASCQALWATYVGRAEQQGSKGALAQGVGKGAVVAAAAAAAAAAAQPAAVAAARTAAAATPTGRMPGQAMVATASNQQSNQGVTSVNVP
jgi:hypothetical protein